MKAFVYLYPIPEYIDLEIEKGARMCRQSKREFRKRYREVLNACIDVRYRKHGFSVFAVNFNNHGLSNVFELRPEDRIIEAGLDFKTHTTKREDNTYPYPDNDCMLDQLQQVKILRIGGFHTWDCVEKFAKRSHERGVDTLVDEDLTQFLTYQIVDGNLKIDRYPNYRPRKLGRGYLKMFLTARKGKPWMWQDYSRQGRISF